MSQKEINQLSRPRGIVVSAVDLGVDSSAVRKLRELDVIQARDPKISETIRAVRQGEIPEGRYLVRHDTLYARDRHFPYWRPVLPTEMENQVINYVHH
jgi:hypothetical protein